MADAHLNFSYSLVATAPSPASSGTSLVVTAGQGVLFPAVPFNATVWPVGVQPLTTNAEIVRVTARSTDTLTITRAQESSSARSIVVGDQIAATITAKTLTDVEPKRTTVGNAAYSILSTDKEVVTSATFTAARIWTLPDASTVNAGYEIIVADEFQTVTSANTLTIAVQSGQKLNGVTNGTEVIPAAGAWRRLISDGTSNWIFDAGILRAGRNLSDLSNITTARVNLGVLSMGQIVGLQRGFASQF